MNRRLQTLKDWCLKAKAGLVAGARKKDNIVVFGAVFAALAVMLAVTAALLLKSTKYDTQDVESTKLIETGEGLIRHPLTGNVLDTPLETLPQVYGVMVENSADAWPLSGLEDAFLVIEAPVEGGIPRFEAFFGADTEVVKIGPVRSARPYYLDWNDEFDGLYAHVGGSPEALNLIADSSTLDLNEFFQGEYFWRDTAHRAAPHNVYTSTELLGAGLAELAPEPAEYASWQFKLDAPLEVDSLSLVIDWGQGELYDVVWAYQPESNQYLRYQDHTVVESYDGDTVLVNNVIVMATNITVIDSLGRRRITTLGEGDAVVVQDGRLILGRWKKLSRTERLRFYTADGQEIKMNAGKTWVEVVSGLDSIDTVTHWPL